MTGLIVLPDVIELVRAYLTGVSEVTDLVPIDRITVSSPRDTSTPWVRLSRIGGLVAVWQRLDRCNLQAESYAPPGETGEQTSFLIARTLRAALFASPGFIGSDGVLTGVEDSMGLIYQPDTSRNPPTPRVVLAVSIYARPNP
jgi:hypothetical protein